MRSERGVTPLVSCADCELDLGDVLRACGRCPLFGKNRFGVQSRCPAFTPKRPRQRVRFPRGESNRVQSGITRETGAAKKHHIQRQRHISATSGLTLSIPYSGLGFDSPRLHQLPHPNCQFGRPQCPPMPSATLGKRNISATFSRHPFRLHPTQGPHPGGQTSALPPRATLFKPEPPYVPTGVSAGGSQALLLRHLPPPMFIFPHSANADCRAAS